MIIYLVIILFQATTVVLAENDAGYYLYYSDYFRHGVYRMDLATENLETLPIYGLVSPLSLDYDYENNTLYIASVQLHTFNVSKFFQKYHLDTGKTETYPVSQSVRISTIAVDPDSGLIFYAERTAQIIAVLTVDFRYESVIISERVFRTSHLVLDTDKRWIYWADWSVKTPHIGRAKMDGSRLTYIVDKNIIEPYAIAFDKQNDRIYWVDNGRKTVERCRPDGRYREVVRTVYNDPPFCMTMAVSQEYIYWSYFREGIIYKMNKNGVGDITTVGQRYRINTTDFRSLTLIEKNSRKPLPVANICSGRYRGGCEQICIPTDTSRVCRCSEGYVLGSDGQSCHEAAYRRGLIVTDVNRRALVALDLDANITKVLFGGWLEVPQGLAFDPTTNEIFWQDRTRNTVYKTCFPDPCLQLIKDVRHKDSFMSALAVDPQAKRIYISDFGFRRISRISYSGTLEEIVVTNISMYVTQIILKPDERKMYFSGEGLIEVANMDNGTDRQVIMNVTGMYISGMAYDPKEEVIYVIRYHLFQIFRISLRNISDQEVLYNGSGLDSLYGLAFAEGNLYFSDRLLESVFELNIATRKVKEYGKRSFKRAVAITYFNLGHPEVSASNPGGFSIHLNLTIIVIVAIAVGGLIIIIIAISCCVCCCMKKRKSEPSDGTEAPGVSLGQLSMASTPKPNDYSTLYEDVDDAENAQVADPPPYTIGPGFENALYATGYQDTELPEKEPLPDDSDAPYVNTTVTDPEEASSKRY